MRPSYANLYSDESEIRMYCAVSPMVIISGGVLAKDLSFLFLKDHPHFIENSKYYQG
jgi:hypothetical protein